MSVLNKAISVVTDVSLDFIFEDDLLRLDHYDPHYELKNSKILLGNISGGTSKSISVYFDPLMCTKSTEISCQVNFGNAHSSQGSVFMEPKLISVVCPIINTDHDINVGRLKEFIEKLPNRNSKIYEIQHGFDISKFASIARDVLEKRNVRHVRTLKTKDGREWEIWYYGRTKVTKADIVIKVSISSEKQFFELFAATESAEALTGLLLELGRDLKSSIESWSSGKGSVINVTIRDSVIQRSNLLDLCSTDDTCPVNILVEDSVIQHSTVISERDERKEESLRKEREEQEKLRRQQEEETRLRKAQEEADRRKKEQERQKQEELHRQREEIEIKQREEAERRKRKEQERKCREEEEKTRREREEAARLEKPQKKLYKRKKEETEKEEVKKKKIGTVFLPSDEVDKIVKEEFNRLSEGQITFIVAKKMKVGISENVKANIAKNLSQINEKVANYYLSRKIKVSSSMKVSLIGEGDNFNIQIITPEIQPIINENVTIWEWIIKPQKSGIQKLLLSVEVIIEVPQYSDRKYHLTTLEENIEVKVNPKYYLECHWEWIAGTIITIILGIFAIIFKK